MKDYKKKYLCTYAIAFRTNVIILCACRERIKTLPVAELYKGKNKDPLIMYGFIRQNELSLILFSVGCGCGDKSRYFSRDGCWNSSDDKLNFFQPNNC